VEKTQLRKPATSNTPALCIIKFGQMSFYRLVIMMLFVVPLTTAGQSKIKPKDSVDIKNQIEGFYSWYVDMIKNHRLNKDFNPSFEKRDDGMTTLNFKNYRAGLSKYKFSNDFIERKINEYKLCVDNLNTIPFDTYVKFELDEHEQINCDFSNTYEWSGGMDPIDGSELVRLNKLRDDKIEAVIKFYYNSNNTKEYKYGTRTFTLIRMSDWQITDFR